MDRANPCRCWVEPDLDLHPGQWLVVDDGGGPPWDEQPIASYDRVTGELYTTLPLPTADVGDACYADSRVWRVERIQVEVRFQPRFFRAGA